MPAVRAAKPPNRQALAPEQAAAGGIAVQPFVYFAADGPDPQWQGWEERARAPATFVRRRAIHMHLHRKRAGRRALRYWPGQLVGEAQLQAVRRREECMAQMMSQWGC